MDDQSSMNERLTIIVILMLITSWNSCGAPTSAQIHTMQGQLDDLKTAINRCH